MDIYHIWCDLKPGQRDLEFVNHLKHYLEHLKAEANLQQYRITRKKLGLGPAEMLEFHIMLEFSNLAELDAAFSHVASREGAVEGLHHAVNGRVNNVKFALYRDFPDDVRREGGEQF